MISRGSMGKQLTGNRVTKMAKGGATKSPSGASKGSASASKASAAKGGAKPAAKSGGSAGGKTINTSSVKSGRGDGGGGGFLGRAAQAVRGALSGGGDKKFTTVTDPQTGKSYSKPSYGALSFKGLTSNDPANVARNRAAAAKYAAMEAARPARSDAEERRSLERRKQAEERMKGTQPQTPSAPAGPTYTFAPPPPGYRPGIDPEWGYGIAPLSATVSTPVTSPTPKVGLSTRMNKGGVVRKGKKK